MRRLGAKPHFLCTSFQRDNLQLVAQNSVGLSTMNLMFPRVKLESLLPLTSLQSIYLYYTAAREAAAYRLLQQQACLTRLRLGCLEYSVEAGLDDTMIHRLTSLQNLVDLDIPLSSLATDAGIRHLSHLTRLQSLRLPVAKDDAGVSGDAVSSFCALNQLTKLSLIGWPITEVHIIRLTCLSSLQRIDFSDCLQLTCLCFMPLLLFLCLHTVEIVRGDDWMIDALVAMFEVIRPSVSLSL